MLPVYYIISANTKHGKKNKDQHRSENY